MTTIAPTLDPSIDADDRTRLEHPHHHSPCGAPLRPHPAADRDRTLQMSLFFLIFRYMFGGAIHAGSIPYVDYLVPGFVATGVLFSGIGAAVATPKTSSTASSTGCVHSRSRELGARRTRDRRHRDPHARLRRHDRDRLRGRLPPPRRHRRARRVRARDRLRLRVRVDVHHHRPVRRQRARPRRACR